MAAKSKQEKLSVYKIAHACIKPLGLNRFKYMRRLRKIAVGMSNKKPILINNEYYLYTDDFDSLDLLTGRKYEEKEFDLLKKIIKPNMIGLDVGANIGFYSVLFAKHSKMVHCFEIQKANYELLNKNIVLNNLQNKAILIHKAVSNKNGKIRIYTGDMNNFANLSKDDLHAHSPSSKNYTVEEVKTIRLDDYFKGLKAPNYAKIDVDGHELEVIMGGMKTLMKTKFIMIEINLKGKKKEVILKLFKKMGFKIKLISGINYWFYK